MKGFKLPKDIIPDSAQLIAGGIGAKLAKNLSKNFITGDSTMEKILRPALPLVIGILLSSQKKLEMVGHGMITVAGADLAGTFIPSLAGIEDMDLSGIFGPLNGPLNGPLSNDQMDTQFMGSPSGEYDQY